MLRNGFDHISMYFKKNSALVGLALLIIVGTIVNPTYFLTVNNLSNVLRQSVLVGLLACGMMFVILCDSIDLTLSAVYAFSAYITLRLVEYSLFWAVVVPLVLGAMVGLINGIIITKLNIMAWVGTLAMSMALRGLLLVVTKGVPYVPPVPLPPILDFIAKETLFGVFPVSAVFLVLIYFAVAYVLKKVRLGRNIYAVGGNKEAASMMGINTASTKIKAHMIACSLAALSGILLTARVGSAYPDAGTGYEMYAVAAVAIGGTYLTGGRGTAVGTFIGAMIMALVTNIFNMQKALDLSFERIVIGLLLLAVVLSQAVSAKKVK